MAESHAVPPSEASTSAGGSAGAGESQKRPAGTGTGPADGPGGVTFVEFRSRSVFRHNAGREIHDLLSHGSIVLDSDTGRVTSVQLTAGDSKTEFQATLAVRYVEDTALKFLVPVEFSERYWRPAKPRRIISKSSRRTRTSGGSR